MTEAKRPSPEESEDTLFEGAIQIAQRIRGNRFALDTLLLAGALKLESNDSVLDLGCGNGALALAIWHLHRPREIWGIEIQSELVALAQRNVQTNRLSSSIRIVQGDIRQIRHTLGDRRFEAVVVNPPYYPARSGRLSPDRERAASRHELHGGLADFIQAARRALAPRGRVWIILPAYRLQELLASLGANRLTPSWIQAVHARANEPASLVLLQAHVGAHPRLSLRPPLVVREGDRYSPPLEALLSGHLSGYPGERKEP